MSDATGTQARVISLTKEVGGSREAATVTRIVKWAEGQRLRPTVTPDHPTKGVGYQPVIQGISGWDPFPIGVYPKRRFVVVEIGHLQRRKPFDAEGLRKELRQRLAEAVPAIDWSAGRKSHFPDVSLEILSEEDALDRFLAVIDWAIARIRRAHAVG